METSRPPVVPPARVEICGTLSAEIGGRSVDGAARP